MKFLYNYRSIIQKYDRLRNYKQNIALVKRLKKMSEKYPITHKALLEEFHEGSDLTELVILLNNIQDI